jgi:hypothetical protein
MAREPSLSIASLTAVIHRHQFVFLASFVGLVGGVLIVINTRTPWPEVIRDFGIAFLAAGTTGIGVEFFTQRGFRRLINADIQGQMLELRSELNFAFNVSLVNYQKSITAWVKDEHFRAISEEVSKVQNSVLKKLAEGIISVPIQLGVAMHSQMMKHFHSRMDAVSFDDLPLWSHIEQAASPHSHHSDADFGRRYYEVILSSKRKNKTVVTRIFVLKREDVAKRDLDLLARIIKKHLEDEIGVAVAFVDNFTGEMETWYQSGGGPRKDFALLNTDQATTFFRHTGWGKYEAFCRCAGKAKEIDVQRELHKSLIVASILGSQDFQEQVSGAYTDAQWKEILRMISDLRSKKERDTSVNSIFAVVLSPLNPDKTTDLDEIKKKIQEAISESTSIGPLIGPP